MRHELSKAEDIVTLSSETVVSRQYVDFVGNIECMYQRRTQQPPIVTGPEKRQYGSFATCRPGEDLHFNIWIHVVTACMGINTDGQHVFNASERKNVTERALLEQLISRQALAVAVTMSVTQGALSRTNGVGVKCSFCTTGYHGTSSITPRSPLLSRPREQHLDARVSVYIIVELSWATNVEVTCICSMYQ